MDEENEEKPLPQQFQSFHLEERMGIAREEQRRSRRSFGSENMCVQRIRLRDASEEELMRLSENLGLSLNSDEMKRIQRYFSEKGRDPTDIELQSIAQAWSCLLYTSDAADE